jgi:hypothetical protein
LKANYPDAQRLYDDFIRLPQDRSHGAPPVGVAAHQQGKRIRLGIDGKTITWFEQL